MKIKTFRGKNLGDVLSRVRNELGENAVILDTKTLSGSVLEVSAGVENDTAVERDRPPRFQRTENLPQRIVGTGEQDYRAAEEMPAGSPSPRIRPAVFPRIVTEQKRSAQPAAGIGDVQNSPGIVDIDRRLIEIEKKIGGTPDTGVKGDIPPKTPPLPPGGDPEFLRWMREREIDPSLYKASGAETTRDASLETKIAVFRKALTGKLRVAPVFTSPGRDGPMKMALVGPTGSGKTTTIAKLASWLTIKKRKKVALLTLDTFRIGAARQLETYAEILQIPFSVVRDAESIRFALGSFGSRDVILIDTTGRNPYRTEEIQHLTRMLKATRVDEIHITLPATHTYRYLRAAWLSYRRTGGDRLIVTKLDEAPACGQLLNLVREFNPQFTFQTFGQMVPDDFRPADPARIVNRIFGAGDHARSGAAVTSAS